MTLAAELTNDQRRELARRHFETAELWLRKLIDHQLTTNFGNNYFCCQFEDGSWLIKSEIRRYVADRRTDEPGRYCRDIDATTFGQAIQIATNPRYDDFFQPALRLAYPDGEAEAKTFLRRLESIRNKVNHGGCCSARDLERAICYTNDLIDSVKAYFAEAGMERAYNVPTITHFVDSLGNESHLDDVPKNVNNRVIDWRRTGVGDLRPGDRITLEIDVDESFDPSEYKVHWQFGNRGTIGQAKQLTIEIAVSDVGQQVEARAVVTSNRDWHQFSWCDNSVCLIYRVLPPP